MIRKLNDYTNKLYKKFIYYDELIDLYFDEFNLFTRFLVVFFIIMLSMMSILSLVWVFSSLWNLIGVFLYPICLTGVLKETYKALKDFEEKDQQLKL